MGTVHVPFSGSPDALVLSWSTSHFPSFSLTPIYLLSFSIRRSAKLQRAINLSKVALILLCNYVRRGTD